ncbi:MAG: BrxA/BrxB family bacilliredoxin [Bacteroidia bacterium]|nr:BrxA/BrxB family bacilliredoxin [Bacteroidia bacterium]
MAYPEMMVAPMRAELTNADFIELKTAEEVENIFNSFPENQTTLVVINSVCGCAAGAMRPGVLHSLHGDKKPQKLYTVFAGMEVEAVAKAREYMIPFPPSSPSIALFKGNKLVHFVERYMIEGKPAEALAANLQAAYNEFC